MRHIHIALVLFACSFITLTSSKSTLVYRRYHRKRPSIRKVQKNVVEIVEVFKTVRRPPAHMKSDKSIENFLLCDAKCEQKRFLKRRKICLRTGRLCPTRPSGSKSQSTTQINVSTRPIYRKPTVYQQNPYGNQNPDYTHLYPWSRPSVTVTKYQPDRSKDFNMTIVEVDKDTGLTTTKYDYEYYDGENDDKYQQRRSTTFRVPTTTWQWTNPTTSTTETTPIESYSTAVPKTSTPTTTIIIPTSTITTTEPPETAEARTVATSTTTEPVVGTTTDSISTTTEYKDTITNAPEPVNLTQTTTTTEFSIPAPRTPTTFFDVTTAPTIETPTEILTEAPITTTTEIFVPPTPTHLPPTTTELSVSMTVNEVVTAIPATSESWTSENQRNATNAEQDEDDAVDAVEYEYEEGEEEEGEGGQANGEDEMYDYDDDGNYKDEDEVPTEDQASPHLNLFV